MALLASNNSNSNLHQPFDRFRHSRSSSTSSTHSAGGHHLSSQSANLNHLNFPTDDHVYRAPFNYAHDGQTVPPSLTRHSSTASTRSNSHSLASTGITSPENSPPTDNNPNPGVKMQPTSIRNARTLSNTPYAREYHYHSGSESVRSSSSEADDIAVFLAQSPGDYPTYVEPSMYNQEAANAAGAFGRMTLDPKQTLLQLAANVQAATTTSASDRAKQIFVQAWYAYYTCASSSY
jgi:regulatory factor X